VKGIDTNILVRFLIGDDETQAKKVYDLFKKAEADRSELFVPLWSSWIEIFLSRKYQQHLQPNQ